MLADLDLLLITVYCAADGRRLLKSRAKDVDGREDLGARIFERPGADVAHGALDDVHVADRQTRKSIAMLAPGRVDARTVEAPDRRAVLNVELEAGRERGQLSE